MGTVYEKTSNYQLALYGNNDPADLRDDTLSTISCHSLIMH